LKIKRPIGEKIIVRLTIVTIQLDLSFVRLTITNIFIDVKKTEEILEV